MTDQGWKPCKAMKKRGWCLMHGRHKRVGGVWYYPIGKPEHPERNHKRHWRKK